MTMKTTCTVCSALALLVGLSAPAGACQIPVFRYALENWPPEPYLLIVAHRGGMSDEDTELLSQLEMALDQARGKLNLEMKVVDLSQTNDPVLETVLGEKIRSIQEPQMVLIYPFSPPQMPPENNKPEKAPPAASPPGLTPAPAAAAGPTPAPVTPAQLSPAQLTPAPLTRTPCPDGKCDLSAGAPRVAWSGDLTAKHIAQLAQSPVRKQITDRLLDGHSAVWVLLECGDQAKDDAAASQLKTTLAKMERTLKLPDKAELVADEHYKPETKVELRIEFSVIRISREHGDDEIFASTLLNSDPSVRADKEPLAISIFGQGRAYFALAGKGIDAASIEEHCRFLTNECSCEVKEANPGIDLLFAVDWQKRITRSPGSERPTPKFSGIGALSPVTVATQQPTETAAAMQSKSVKSEVPAPSAPAEAATASPPSKAAIADSASEAPLSRVMLTWVLGPAAIGLMVVLLGTLWLRSGRPS